MIEATTEAIVLDKEDLGECDSRVFLYTKDFGRVSAKATSARKIVSKLSSHIQPLNYITARLASRGDLLDRSGFQLTDALLINSSENLKADLGKAKEAIRAFSFLNLVVPPGIPDLEFWNFLNELRNGSRDAGIKNLLGFLGFDPVFANCEFCNRLQPEYFFPKNNFFICRFCIASSSQSKKDFISIKV